MIAVLGGLAVRMIDFSLFHETGGVILTWSVNAAQPTALVFRGRLREETDDMRLAH
jgi:hypothetical protein